MAEAAASPEEKAPASSERIEILKRFPLFSELVSEELEMISAAMQEVEIEGGTDILVQNEDADAVYFLTHGGVKILINGEMVALVDTVQCFGEMSCLIPDTPASATVQTADTSKFYKTEKEVFLEVVSHIPRLWKTLFLQMNGRFKAVNMRLSEVLEHTPQGLIKVDKEGVITNEYSIECTRYFSKDNLAGIPFYELIHPDDADAREAWAEGFKMLFDEDAILPFEHIADLLTKELKYPHPDETVSEFVFSYYPCRGLDGSMTAIDIGIEDVTEARELERKNEEMQAEQKVMGKIYENPESFINLKKFMEETIGETLKLIKLFKTKPSVELTNEIELGLRKLHSLKGFSGMFALKSVQDAVHHLETLVKDAQAQDKAKVAKLVELADGLKVLKSGYDYTSSRMDKIGASLKKRLLGVPFTIEEFEKLKGFQEGGDLAGIGKLIEEAEKVDALKLVHGWDEETQRLGSQMDKSIDFDLTGEGGQISKKMYLELSKVLMHLLRNAVDHGVEPIDERLEADKTENGKIEVSLNTEEETLTLSIEDDGRGIDYDQVIEAAKAKEDLDQGKVQSIVDSGEPWHLLFLSGMSTAKEVTDVSGRGVGLDAVAKTVEDLGGSVKVDCEVGKFTRFTISIPLT